MEDHLAHGIVCAGPWARVHAPVAAAGEVARAVPGDDALGAAPEVRVTLEAGLARAHGSPAHLTAVGVVAALATRAGRLVYGYVLERGGRQDTCSRKRNEGQSIDMHYTFRKPLSCRSERDIMHMLTLNGGWGWSASRVGVSHQALGARAYGTVLEDLACGQQTTCPRTRVHAPPSYARAVVRAHAVCFTFGGTPDEGVSL